MLDIIPPDVHEILKRLHEHGHDVWVVGGALRDAMAGLPPKDYDLATSAPPDGIGRLFRRVVPVGIRHGTVTILTEKRGVEATSLPARGRAAILADLARRDFTMNALALSYPEGEWIDPHHGRKDLLAGLLRAVGDPAARLREDPLRVFRAGRFVSLYGFTIAPGTMAAMRAEAPGLARVAVERIREELFKTLCGKEVITAFHVLHGSGALQWALAELLELPQQTAAGGDRSLFDHTVETVHHCPARLRIRLAALLHALGTPNTSNTQGLKPCPADPARSAARAAALLDRLRAPGRLSQEVGAILRHQITGEPLGWGEVWIRQLIARAGPKFLEDILDLAYAHRLASPHGACSLEDLSRLRDRLEEAVRRNPILGVQDLAIDGEDIMEALGLGPGPAVGRLLRSALEKVVEDPACNERKILIDFVRKTYHKRV